MTTMKTGTRIGGWRVRMQMIVLAIAAVAMVTAACGKKKPPIAQPVQPPPAEAAAPPARPPAPPQPVAEPPVAAPAPVRDDAVASASLDDLNRNSPLKPVFYDFDSSELNAASQSTLKEDAEILKKNPTWAVTVEGHCDERGTAEYNLALGERRAVA